MKTNLLPWSSLPVKENPGYEKQKQKTQQSISYFSVVLIFFCRGINQTACLEAFWRN